MSGTSASPCLSTPDGTIASEIVERLVTGLYQLVDGPTVATTHLVSDDDQREAAHGLLACDAASLLKRSQCRSSLLERHIDVRDRGSAGRPCSPAQVGVPAVLDAEEDDLARLVEHAIEDSVGSPASRPDPHKVVAEWLADTLRLCNQCGREEVDNGRGDALGEPIGDGTPGRRREDELVVVVVYGVHPRSRRTASTPRATSLRA